MKAFSERNAITVGVVGMVALAAVATATFYSDDLPGIGGGDEYSARFANAAGLKTGDDVRIAGVKVGSIESISLERKHVLVEFKVKDAWVGNESTAAISIKTVLGQEYIALDPQGKDTQDSDSPIPLSRTSTPLDVTAALNGLSSTVGSIDTGQLAQSLDTLSSAFADTPTSVRSALTGLSRLSRTIASRDTALQALAAQTQKVSTTLAGNTREFTTLIKDGALLLQELQARSGAITKLLSGTRDLASQVAGLVKDNQKTLGPALDQLSRVTTILTSNRGNLKRALSLIGPYYALLNDSAGSGPWLDIYICGLFDSSDAPVLNKTATRNCAPRGSK